MSATPRTDAQVQSTNRQIDLIGCAPDGGLGPVDAVTAEFARQLERELDKCITAGLLMSAELKRRDGPNDAQDAARYRWLRDVAHEVEDAPLMLDINGLYFQEDPTAASIDAAIDATMKRILATPMPSKERP